MLFELVARAWLDSTMFPLPQLHCYRPDSTITLIVTEVIIESTDSSLCSFAEVAGSNFEKVCLRIARDCIAEGPSYSVVDLNCQCRCFTTIASCLG